jgi:hypothetical protein
LAGTNFHLSCEQPLKTELRVASCIQNLDAAANEHFRHNPYQSHADNLAALCAGDKTLGLSPSYAAIRRFVKAQGLVRVTALGGRSMIFFCGNRSHDVACSPVEGQTRTWPRIC